MGNGNILIPLDRLEDLEASLKDIAIPLLKDNWTEDNGVYKQTVLVDGLKADWTPNIMLSSVGAEATDDELNAYVCLDGYIVEDGSITFVASEIPSISFTVIAKGVMASEGQAIADVTALVSKVNGLEKSLPFKETFTATKTSVSAGADFYWGFELPQYDGFVPILTSYSITCQSYETWLNVVTAQVNVNNALAFSGRNGGAGATGTVTINATILYIAV